MQESGVTAGWLPLPWRCCAAMSRLVAGFGRVGEGATGAVASDTAWPVNAARRDEWGTSPPKCVELAAPRCRDKTGPIVRMSPLGHVEDLTLCLRKRLAHIRLLTQSAMKRDDEIFCDAIVGSSFHHQRPPPLSADPCSIPRRSAPTAVAKSDPPKRASVSRFASAIARCGSKLSSNAR